MNESKQSLRSSKLLRINSKNRTNPSSSNQYDFTVNFDSSDLNQSTRVVLKSITVPNTQYNINTNNNTIDYNGVSSVSIPVGNYSLSELITAIETAFSAINVVVVSQDNTTKKLTLTFTSNIVLDDTSSMKYVLGFIDTTSSATAQVMPNLPSLEGLQKVFVKSSKLSNSSAMIDSSKQSLNIFTEIDIDVPFGYFAHRFIDDLHTSDELTFSQPKNLTDIDIKLYDQDLNPLELNGHHFEMVLKVFHL